VIEFFVLCFSGLCLLQAIQSCPIAMVRPLLPITNKYQVSPLSKKSKKLISKFELSSIESVTTGLIIHHKGSTAKKSHRNGLAIMLYISKEL
jgi:hypothetical protein